MSSKKNVIAIAVTTVALTVGSIGVGQAASKTKVVSTKVTRTSSNGIANPMAKPGGPEEVISSVLSALVTKGTITQAQADAIKAAFIAAKPARGLDGRHKGEGRGDEDKGGRGHGGPGKGGMGSAPKIPAPTASPSA